jgi:hypothetical protein
VRNNGLHRNRLKLGLLLFAPVVAGCSGGSDLLSKDAEWFSRPGRLFIRNISIDSPPLTPNKQVGADDLVSAEGSCPGTAPAGGNPSDANAAKQDAAAAPLPSTMGTVALGHTECDVVRGIGAPASVNLSSNPRGERVAVISYSQGQRAGIYTFTAYGKIEAQEKACCDLIEAWLPVGSTFSGSSAGRFVVLRTHRQPFFFRPLQRALGASPRLRKLRCLLRVALE